MTSALASLFKSLFPAITLGLVLAVLGGAVWLWQTTGSLPLGGLALVAGLAAVVALFGIVALQIENNLLLHRIAAGQGGELPLTPHAETPRTEAPHAPRASLKTEPKLAANRTDATPRHPATTRRVEPVLSLSRKPQLPAAE